MSLCAEGACSPLSVLAWVSSGYSGFPPTPQKDTRIRLTGYSESPIGVKVSVNGSFLCDGQIALLPEITRDWLHLPYSP